MVPAELFRGETVSMDATVATFAALVALLASVGFGLAPAWTGVRTDVQAALRDGGKTSSGKGARRFLRLLVVMETAGAMVLLVGAGLVLNGFLRLRAVDRDRPHRTLTSRSSPPTPSWRKRPGHTPSSRSWSSG